MGNLTSSSNSQSESDDENQNLKIKTLTVSEKVAEHNLYLEKMNSMPYTSFSILKDQMTEATIVEGITTVVKAPGKPKEKIDHELQLLQSLPKFEPLLKKMESKNWKQSMVKFDIFPISVFCYNYKEMLEQFGSAVAKNQRSIISKLTPVDYLANKSFLRFKEATKDVKLVEEILESTKSLSRHINRLNRELSSVIWKIETLLSYLPDNVRMEEPLPMPVLTLGKFTLSQEEIESVQGASKNLILVREGVKNSTRRRVWQNAIGNSLRITKDHFNKYLQHVQTKKLRMEENPDLKKNNEFENVYRLIKVDVPRTFPSLEICSNPQSSYYKDLSEILESYAIFRPAVGQIFIIQKKSQGMSYVAGMLLLHMDKFEAFVCFCNLLNSHFFVSLFKMNVIDLKKHLAVYDLIFSANLPELYEHFKNLQIMHEHYILSWLSTIYSKVLPLSVACRVWDSFLVEGEIYLYRTALGILRLSNEKFLNSGFEECVGILKQFGEQKVLNEKELFDSITNVTVQPYIKNIISRIEEGQS